MNDIDDDGQCRTVDITALLYEFSFTQTQILLCSQQVERIFLDIRICGNEVKPSIADAICLQST